ncbi:MAG: DUF357 domain-containing protein [Candidatus Pacearchaeota archaeon]
MKKEGNAKQIEYIKKEFNFSKRALEIAKKNLTKDKAKLEKAREFVEMAESYLSDSMYFFKQKDYLRAIAAIYYAHAWLDAGARLEFWKIKGKNKKYFSID